MSKLNPTKTAEIRNIPAVKISTATYRGEIFTPQYLQRPREIIHPATGKISGKPSRVSQFSHRDGGETIEIPRGTR